MMCHNTTIPALLDLNLTWHQELQQSMRYHVYHIILPIIFFIGMVGNILNLLLFGYRVHTINLEQLERSATAGLISLAVSDFLFCLVGFPAAFFPESVVFLVTDGYSDIVGFYYNAFKMGLHNLFLFTSTWLVVAISVERYIAVCHPLKARWIIKVGKTVCVHMAIYIIGVLLCIPDFVRYKIISEDCSNGCSCLIRQYSRVIAHPRFKSAHNILWSTVGTYIPLVALIFTNTNLVLGLLRSRALSMTEPDRYSCGRITKTVIAIVFSFLILVCPSMVVQSLSSFNAFGEHPNELARVGTTIIVLNLLQGIKFASNFIMYCALNKQFRDNLRRAIKRERPSKTYITSEATKRTFDVELV